MLYTVTNAAEPIHWGARGDYRVLQNIANLLRAWQGTIPFQWGVGLDPSIQDAVSGESDALIMAEIDRNITQYAPDAEIFEIRIAHSENGLDIAVDVEVDVT